MTGIFILQGHTDPDNWWNVRAFASEAEAITFRDRLEALLSRLRVSEDERRIALDHLGILDPSFGEFWTAYSVEELPFGLDSN